MNAKPRIYYLASGPVPSQAANSIHVVKMDQALRDMGFETTIIAPRTRLSGRPKDSDVAVYYGIAETPSISRVWAPDTRGGTWLYRTGLLLKLIGKRRPEFVYGRNLMGCLVAARLGLTTVFEAHMPVWENSEHNSRMFREMSLQKSFHGVVVISRALADSLAERYPALEDRIVLAHDAASDCKQSRPPRRNHSGPPKVLYAGSLYPGKGMELILELSRKCPEAGFKVLGGSTGEIMEWAGKASEGASNIEFIGHRPHASVADYLLDADVLVAPYQPTVMVHGRRRDVARWMSPLKIFEYMSAGRPIIASDLPVLREVLAHRVNALLVDPEDSDSWVDAVRELIRNPVLAENLASRARADYENKYTWRSRARHIIESLGWRQALEH